MHCPYQVIGLARRCEHRALRQRPAIEANVEKECGSQPRRTVHRDAAAMASGHGLNERKSDSPTRADERFRFAAQVFEDPIVLLFRNWVAYVVHAEQ